MLAPKTEDVMRQHFWRLLNPLLTPCNWHDISVELLLIVGKSRDLASENRCTERHRRSTVKGPCHRQGLSWSVLKCPFSPTLTLFLSSVLEILHPFFWCLPFPFSFPSRAAFLLSSHKTWWQQWLEADLCVVSWKYRTRLMMPSRPANHFAWNFSEAMHLANFLSILWVLP